MRAFVALALTFCFASSSFAQDKKSDKEVPARSPVVGNWEGTLSAGVLKLRLGFKVMEKDGALVAGMVSIDQGEAKVPVEKALFKDGEVFFDLPLIKAEFKGKLSEDRQSIKGTFKQGVPLPFELKKVEKFSASNRPQHPKAPFPYFTEDVTIENAGAKLTLAGTLTKPKGDGPFPVVVFITGSGPQNRDEQLFGHRPFLVVADHLTKNGIATLRCDDRGVGKSTGKFADATSADFATDIEACVAWLKKRSDIKANKIGLIGHSEGGMIAPLVAARSKDVAFIVMLAGPGVSGAKILLSQGELITEKAGKSGDAIARLGKAIREKLVAMVLEDATDAAIGQALEKVLKDWKAAGRTDDEIETMKSQTKQLYNPWFRFFLKYDPVPTLKQVQCPVLAINGELDLQVPHEANLDAISKALRDGGNKDFTVKMLPKLNHLFQTSKNGLPTEYGQLEETFAPSALELISSWVKKRCER